MTWKRTEGISLVTGASVEFFEIVDERQPTARGEIDRSFVAAVQRAKASRRDQPYV